MGKTPRLAYLPSSRGFPRRRLDRGRGAVASANGECLSILRNDACGLLSVRCGRADRLRPRLFPFVSRDEAFRFVALLAGLLPDRCS